MKNHQIINQTTDAFTSELLDELFASNDSKGTPDQDLLNEMIGTFKAAQEAALTKPILDFFDRMRLLQKEQGLHPADFGLTRAELDALARRHAEIDEHGVSVGGRLMRAVPIVGEAAVRVEEYLEAKGAEAPSGMELWDQIQTNAAHIQKVLKMSSSDWLSYPQQLSHAIDSVETLARLVKLPPSAVRDIVRVTESYRMRLTPYYASLIQPGCVNDPVLIQCVPTGEMIDNVGVEIPPVAADHSPARLVDQFYPRVVTIKATNMCAMYCTHCLRIAHIGKKDRIYSMDAYGEALDYIRNNRLIRDVLITGGDAFILPNKILKWLLGELDAIDHVTMKRIGTRIPVTAPMRIDSELLDILGHSNDIKPVRVVTQINTAQEITPLSREGFKKLSGSVMAVLNQAVLLKGINDTRTKMWKLCETMHESYVRPYYIFNCSYRNPQFAHLRVPVEVGRDIVESMYGNISGDAIPRYIATAGGKITLHRNNVVGRKGNNLLLSKPWSGEVVNYPDPDTAEYSSQTFAFSRYES